MAKTMKTLAVALLALGVAGPAAAESWTVDYSESRLGFEGAQGAQKFEGSFGEWSAEISFDPNALDAAKADVTIVMGSARTGAIDRDGALPGRDWFAVAMFPDAQFETKAFRALGDDAYEADATLTIKGVARDVTLPFTLSIADGVARMKGALDILRTDYKVGEGQWANAQAVALEVRIVVDLLARADGFEGS